MSEQAIMKAFAFEGRTVRVDLFDGEPWWAARDVVLSLGYAESSDTNSLMSKVPPKWKGPKRFGTPGGVQEILGLSEQGLYFFLGRSDKPAALPFQEWIAGEVIPSIRRTGQYSMVAADPTVLGLPDFNDPFAAAEAWAKEGRGRVAAEAQVKQLAAKVEVDAPRVSFAASVEASDTSYLVGQVAKIIKRGTGIDVGQNRLFTWLRERGYIHKGGSQHNEPTQRTQDMGLMFVNEHVSMTKTGKELVTRTPRITGKGKLFFYEKFHQLALKRGLISQAVPPDMTQQDLFGPDLTDDDF